MMTVLILCGVIGIVILLAGYIAVKSVSVQWLRIVLICLTAAVILAPVPLTTAMESELGGPISVLDHHTVWMPSVFASLLSVGRLVSRGYGDDILAAFFIQAVFVVAAWLVLIPLGLVVARLRAKGKHHD